MSLTCTRCGAALELPTDRSVEAFPCPQCSASQLVSAPVDAPAVERKELERVLAESEAHSRRNTRAMLLVAACVVVAVFVVLVVTRPPPPAPPNAAPTPTVHAIGIAKVRTTPTPAASASTSAPTIR